MPHFSHQTISMKHSFSLISKFHSRFWLTVPWMKKEVGAYLMHILSVYKRLTDTDQPSLLYSKKIFLCKTAERKIITLLFFSLLYSCSKHFAKVTICWQLRELKFHFFYLTRWKFNNNLTVNQNQNHMQRNCLLMTSPIHVKYINY